MTKFHVHLISDATGETLTALANAAITQFEVVESSQHLWPMVRNKQQLDDVVANLKNSPGVVLFTLVQKDLRDHLVSSCRMLRIPCVLVLDPVLRTLAAYFGVESKDQPGRQHVPDADYFNRIDAMDFAFAHDDGQGTPALAEADVVLVGVSRTSKTPTCVYLANRGVRAANVPRVPGQPLPEELAVLGSPAIDPFIVGLTASPDRLIQIRRNRLLELKETPNTPYTDAYQVRTEVKDARQVFARNDWTLIDVTRRSIEETAAKILALLERRRETGP